ncbi:zinc finger protein GLIS2 [Chanos chanos]|uniref:Zinc finger protein GLIS2 n=1 Tax=Chanos chanos TaxID=29144 RepID=A0A6J2W3A5_CHACN|nr:zinc finger protein GLIS2-like [Chanos chanos]
MLSLDEPLDLKVPSERNRTIHRTSICAPLHARTRQLRPRIPDPCSPPAVDLSLSPSPRHASSPPSPPERLSDCSPPGSSLAGESVHYLEDSASAQEFRYFLPIEAKDLPSSVLIGQSCAGQTSSEPPVNKHLACGWLKCRLLFDSLQDLVDHVNDLHVKPEKDSRYCCYWEGCVRNGRSFNARYKMLIHIRTHTNEKPHHCPTCSKSFSRLENLKIHNRSHTGEKPYICPYKGCNKRYSNSSDRFKHTRTHYVDKPYCCKMVGCLKRYTDPSSLRKHIKAHGHSVAQGRIFHSGYLTAPDAKPGLCRKTLDVSYQGGAHVILPGAVLAALLEPHGLQGFRGPLATLRQQPLGLSWQARLAAGCSFLSGGVSPSSGRGSHWSPTVLPGPLLEMGVHQSNEEEREVEEERDEDAGRGHDFQSWVVFPPGALVLRPTVFN